MAALTLFALELFGNLLFPVQNAIGVGDGGQQGRSPPPGFRSGAEVFFAPPGFDFDDYSNRHVVLPLHATILKPDQDLV